MTNRDDVTADWLVLELRRQGREFVRVDSEDYPEAATLCWSPDQAELRFAHCIVVARDVRAVWWRRSVAPVLHPHDRTADELQWAWEQATAGWSGFWRSIDAHWVNHPDAIAAADIKPRQLTAARLHGLSTPATLLTNDPVAAGAFAARHDAVVCKAVGSALVGAPGVEASRLLYTQRLDSTTIAAIDGIGPEPYLFQELVRKECDVRVTVIGERAYGCRIDSQSVESARTDWRLGDLDKLAHEAIELPEAIGVASVALARHFGLRFAALDYAVTPDGAWIFFEVNPNGQWAWIEQLTGQPLAAALVAELYR